MHCPSIWLPWRSKYSLDEYVTTRLYKCTQDAALISQQFLDYIKVRAYVNMGLWQYLSAAII